LIILGCVFLGSRDNPGIEIVSILGDMEVLETLGPRRYLITEEFNRQYGTLEGVFGSVWVNPINSGHTPKGVRFSNFKGY
jgi:hypothetical protein